MTTARNIRKRAKTMAKTVKFMVRIHAKTLPYVAVISYGT
jgi:hypothetical protein